MRDVFTAVMVLFALVAGVLGSQAAQTPTVRPLPVEQRPFMCYSVPGGGLYVSAQGFMLVDTYGCPK